MNLLVAICTSHDFMSLTAKNMQWTRTHYHDNSDVNMSETKTLSEARVFSTI